MLRKSPKTIARRNGLGYIGYGTHFEKYNGFCVHGPFATGYEILASGMTTVVSGVYSILECRKIINSNDFRGNKNAKT